jgi:hypothetical protein
MLEEAEKRDHRRLGRDGSVPSTGSRGLGLLASQGLTLFRTLAIC